MESGPETSSPKDELNGVSRTEQCAGDQSDAAPSVSTQPNVKADNTAPVEFDSKREGGDGETIIVDWDGPDDPQNPKNWPSRRKWSTVLTMSAFTFISPIASSMVAPAASSLGADLNIHGTTELAMTVSVFVLAYAVGPLFLGPLSEIYGRSILLKFCNAFFIAWNLACGFAQSKGQLIAFRFLSGLGGSCPLSVGGAVLSDVWLPDQRGQAIAIYSLAPLLGPVIGPIAGAWMAEKLTWRWVFWSTSIAASVSEALGLYMLEETFAPVLLDRKANKIRAQLDLENGSGGVRTVRTIYGADERRWQNLFAKRMLRPFIMFGQEPMIQLIGLYMAFAYGIIYLTLTTFPQIFTDVYHESIGIGGLNYIALGVGFTLASQINARLLDILYARLKAKNGGIGKPEFRLLNVMPGTMLLPLGLLMAGWAAQEKVYWLVTDIGFGLAAAGIILIFQGMQVYVIDAFTAHAASALGAVACLRSLAGFGFPLFAPAMYNALGYGKGNTILAALATAIGIPAVWIFWLYGEKLRGMSKNTKKG